MKRPIRRLFAAVIPCAVLAATVAVAPPAVTAATGTSNWSTLEQTALQVTAGYRDDGPLTVAGPFSAISISAVTTPSGPVSVAQRSVVATDGSGTVALNLTLLGGRQLVVTEMSPATGYAGETLVLTSGTSTIAGTYPLYGAGRTDATTTAAHRSERHRGTAATDAVLSTTRGGDRATARLVTVGGCYADPQAPGVIGSTFGPLVMGEGIITCGTYENLAEIDSLYRGSTHVGNTATGSNSGTFLNVNSFDGCTVISGTHSFHTAELWSVNGTVQGGATSTSANLHCT